MSSNSILISINSSRPITKVSALSQIFCLLFPTAHFVYRARAPARREPYSGSAFDGVSYLR
jgi:hypothetical protein